MPDPDQLSPRDWGLLAALCAAQVLEVLGVTVVIVALPATGRALGLGGFSLQLVVSVYAAVYGGLLLIAGRISDVFDRRSVFMVGLSLTLAGAVGCALAPTSVVLLVARGIQGLGGAFVTPAALALLTASFPAGRARRIAVSAWTAAAAGGGAMGFVVGGLVVDAIGWRGVFWLLVPIAAIALVTGRWLAPAHPPHPERNGLDIPGAVCATAGLVVLVCGAGLVGQTPGTPLPAALALVIGMSLLGAFVALQKRGRSPLIAWSALTNREFMTANGAAFLNTATTSASSALVALVAQHLMGLRARDTGVVLLPFSLMVVLGCASGSWWLRRRPPLGMAIGLLTIALAMLALAAATAAGTAAGLSASVGLAGLGLSWAAVTSTSAATHALPSKQAGVASAAVNTAAQIGTALGVATLLALAGLLGAHDHRTGYIAAFAIAAAAAAGYAGLLLLGASAEPTTAHRPPQPARRASKRPPDRSRVLLN